VHKVQLSAIPQKNPKPDATEEASKWSFVEVEKEEIVPPNIDPSYTNELISGKPDS